MTRRLNVLTAFLSSAVLVVCCLSVALAQDDAGAGQATTAAEPMVLTLEDVIGRVFDANYDLKLAQLAIEEAVAARGEAKAPDRWQLDFDATYARRGPVTAVSDNDTYDYGISLAKSLYSSGRNKALRDLAELNIDVKGLEADAARRQVALSATTLFYSISRAEALVGVSTDTVANARSHWKQAGILFEGGKVPRFDVMSAEVDVANAEQNLIVVQTQVEALKASLKRLLAIDVMQPIEIAATPDPSPLTVDPQNAIAIAQESREELRVAAANINQALTSKRIARAARGLNVNLVGSYDQIPASTMSADHSWSVAVAVSKPLNDGGASRSQEAQAAKQVEQAQTQFAKLQDDIADEVWQAYIAMEEAKSRLLSTAKTVDLAAEALRLSEIRYAEDVAIQVEVSDARVALATAQTNHVNAIYGYQVAEAELVSAVNVPVERLVSPELRSE